MNQDNIDEILGITRCVQCGQRLDGEIECPFCSALESSKKKRGLPKWLYITACFLTSPFSLYAIVNTGRLTVFEKIITFTGCFFWAGLVIYFSVF
jgi:hypothetical protein